MFDLTLSNKSTDDLQKTIQDLSTKLSFVIRTGNSQMINQLQMYLEMYKSEYSKRIDELYKKQNIQNNIQVGKK
jgi:hypothetical protein